MENEFLDRLRNLDDPDVGTLIDAGIVSLDKLLLLIKDRQQTEKLRGLGIYLLRCLKEYQAVPVLLEIAQDHSELQSLRSEAVVTLGNFQLGDKGSVPVLIDLMLHDPDTQVRALAANGLGWLGDERGYEPLLQILQNQTESPLIRGEAAEAMANGHFERAIPALISVLTDPSPEVRFWAIFALGQLGDPSVISYLEKLVDDQEILENWWSVGKEARDAIEILRGTME